MWNHNKGETFGFQSQEPHKNMEFIVNEFCVVILICILNV